MSAGSRASRRAVVETFSINPAYGKLPYASTLNSDRSDRELAGQRAPGLLESDADAIFLTAVEEFQVFHFLVFHGEEEEAGDRLFDLLFRQHLGIKEFLERALLVLLALLRGGFDAGVLGAGAGADSAHSHAADTPAAAALGALTAGAVVAGE